MIAGSVAIKAVVVADDHKENSRRQTLNFGHTIAHAIERVLEYRILHGEAVAIGMMLAARLSARLGRAPAADTARLAALLARFGLPTAIPAGLDADTLIALMQLDKKNLSGRLRLILWRGVGKAEIVPDVDAAAIQTVLREGLRAKD